MDQTGALPLLQGYCERLARLDVEGCLELFAEDAVVRAPFVPDPIPKRMDGREAFAAAFRPVGALFGTFRWTALDAHATDDPSLAFATGSSEITLVDGRPYTQDYVFVLRERDGRISEYTEYMDPIRAQAALAGFAPVAAADEVTS
jgi:ketosteroid isomerase-like protein